MRVQVARGSGMHVHPSSASQERGTFSRKKQEKEYALAGLFHRGERGRLEDEVAERVEDRPVLLGLGALGDPFGIVLEGRPLLLALGKRFPFQEIVVVVV